MTEIKINQGITNGPIEDKIYRLLPETLQHITQAFAGRERDIVLTSALGVLSTCLPNVYGFYDGDKTYPHLYVMIIAPAASGKGVMNKSRILIDKIHDKVLKDSISIQKNCKEEKKNAKESRGDDCPSVEIKVMPANISTAEMYSHMGASNYGVLIMESEADTMSNMLNNDWSNYSDILRKCFHHEPISISRKMEKIFEDIKEPKLSLVMSGTPEQLKTLIKSKENGLYSRFIVYTFDEISQFKNVFSPTARNYNMIFEQEAKKIFDLYGKLAVLNDQEIEFKLTENQEQIFLHQFADLHEKLMRDHPHSFISNLNRHGLIFFRIAMILSALRNIENMVTDRQLTCSRLDFLLALKITKTLLKHSLVTFNSFDDDVMLSENDEKLLFALNPIFKREDAIELGAKHQIPKRTMDDKLKQWKKKKIITPVKHGVYKRSRTLM
ncbi:DUF3987 domain-containing protein [Chryseobacterium nematophagum]|uniref:DUF3987 domain-containing protein n=1 Tax=Chryseobacterium nematophagum TaxID=2305228 RepID=A0A3M7LDR1_9FLAO|nr:DUF3987 domain-containing protein [Chryseobacterium nematophagum]RMZ60369.1 DUF3987 domain-containing protein [Chryseobacterium nematophagum]